MTYASDRRPDAGDLSTLLDLHATLRARAEELDDLRAALGRSVDDTGTDAWAGESGEAWRVEVSTQRYAADRLSGWYDRAASAVTVYVDAVEEISRQAEPWRERLDSAELTLNRLYGDPEYTGTLQCYEPATRDMVRARVQADAEQDQDDAWTALRGLFDDRRCADTALCEGLEAGISPAWTATRSALTRLGIDTVDELTDERASRAILELATTVASGDAEAQQRADLEVLLVRWKTDDDVVDRVFAELGGAATVRLVDEAANAGQVDLAAAVRSALSTASADWSTAEAQKFTGTLMNEYTAATGGVAAIGYLFADVENAPLGAELATAAATEADRIERLTPGAWSGGWSEMSLSGVGGLTGDRAQGARVNDAAGRILQTLGQYPDAALDWLWAGDGDAVHDDRISYWFETRDWSRTGDGFEGPAALWGGASRASGGPADGWTDDAASERVASVTSAVVRALAANQELFGENVSTAGSQELAHAVGVHLPALVEYPLTSNFAGQVMESRYWKKAAILGSEHPVAIPVIEDSEVKRLLAVVGGDPTAPSGALRPYILQYEERAIEAGLDPTNPVDARAAIDRITTLSGALSGASAGNDAAVAVRYDDGVREMFGAGATAAGAAPVRGGFAGGGYVLSLSAGAASDCLADLVATRHGEALAQEAADQVEIEAALRSSLEAYVERLGPEAFGPSGEGTASVIDDIVSDHNDSYDSAYLHAEGKDR
ncbi:hypothetical protein [Paraoerskovia marina]|uniref:hypothetical protein n=1 Tax=Paraoerskovia marina TaxID=545619 RepID=UPI000492617F|nr:hypothetical protein [Paraoerskovia marina]